MTRDLPLHRALRPVDAFQRNDDRSRGGAQCVAILLEGARRMWSSATITQAIEWAADPDGDGNFADHLDVINLSVGCSVYGSSFELSCERAVDNAALAGVAVAAAAGNNSDGFYNTGSPESSVRALSVERPVCALIMARAPRSMRRPRSPALYTRRYQGFGTLVPVTQMWWRAIRRTRAARFSTPPRSQDASRSSTGGTAVSM